MRIGITEDHDDATVTPRLADRHRRYDHTGISIFACVADTYYAFWVEVRVFELTRDGM